MALKISSYFKLNAPLPVEWLQRAEHLLIGYPDAMDIFFFYKPLLDQRVGGKSAFYRLPIPFNDLAIDAILLRFFLEHREVDILVISEAISDALPLDKSSLSRRLDRLFPYAEKVTSLDANDIVHLRRYSCWVNSEFPRDRLNEFAGIFLGDRALGPIEGTLVCTEKGFFFQIIEPYYYALYERYILMYGLLLAYQISLEIFINELAFFTIENMPALEQLRKECAQFNAIFYFTNPIKPGNTNLRPAWNKLMRPFNIETLTSELTDQLEAVTQIHHIEQERERREKEQLEQKARFVREKFESEQEKLKQRRQNIFNFWLSIIGMLLTALTVVEITPSELVHFFREWREFFIQLF